QLRQAHQPAAALESLDALEARFPNGALADAARLARIEALLSLGRAADALALLDGAPGLSALKGQELLVLRGELRESAGRHVEALADFQAATRAPLAAVRERAVYGAAGALARLGRDEEARAALEAYLDDFPAGRFAAAARTALGR
ncbi:MAG: hypothetical protein K1X89_27480, partial [Myxococcaceae bacterium]|nr:hypothetical protein [Myxococcaceae bacterium]